MTDKAAEAGDVEVGDIVRHTYVDDFVGILLHKTGKPSSDEAIVYWFSKSFIRFAFVRNLICVSIL